MTAERERIQHPDHIGRAVRILLAQVFQDPYLLLRLAVESLLVADHLECDARAVAVIVDLDDLTEASLTQHAQNLVAVRYVVMWHVHVRALVVVVAVVVGTVQQTLLLLGIRTDKVDLRHNSKQR